MRTTLSHQSLIAVALFAGAALAGVMPLAQGAESSRARLQITNRSAELVDLLQVSPSDGKPIELLPTEMRLLEYMLRRPVQVLTRTMLLEHVWDFDFKFDLSTDIVDVHVGRLRRKLDAGHEGKPPLV